MRPYKVFDGYIDLDKISFISDIKVFEYQKPEYVVYCVRESTNTRVIESNDKDEATKLYNDLIAAWKGEPKESKIKIESIDKLRSIVDEFNMDVIESTDGNWYVVERK